METDQLKDVVERKHGGSAQFARSVPVRETFEGKAVWEGMVHVFDLVGHPTATRAYAWSSPIEGSTKRRLFQCCIPHGSTRLWKLCERQSGRSIAQQGESTPGISAAWNRLGAAVARVLELRLRNQSV